MEQISALHFFSIIGAQRCGTSYLYKMMDSHPNICMARPLRPEPKFFLDEEDFKKGIESYINKYYKNIGDEVRVIGEKGTSYLEYPKVGGLIKQYFSSAKIIVILRNPIDRALSNYFFSIKNRIEGRTLGEVFIENKPTPIPEIDISVSPYDYIQRGKYLEYLLPYYKLFGDNFKVVIYEETVDSIEVIQSIYEFLGVDPNHIPTNINNIVNSSNYASDDKEHEINLVKDKLRVIFLDEIKKLEKFLNKDLSIWYD